MTAMGETGVMPPEGRPIGLGQIFVAFSLIGLSGFGGVLPIAHHALVQRRRWLTPAEFTELLSICQLLPGPNIVNLTICFGTRAYGLAGAIAGVAGLLLMPLVIVLLLAEIYANFKDLPEVSGAFRGIAAAAAGLIVAMAVRMARPVVSAPRALFLATAAFLAIIGFQMPLVWVIAILAPISIAWAWISRDE
jgi:chromate transporter